MKNQSIYIATVEIKLTSGTIEKFKDIKYLDFGNCGITVSSRPTAYLFFPYSQIVSVYVERNEVYEK